VATVSAVAFTQRSFLLGCECNGDVLIDGRPSFDEVSQLYIDPIECTDCGACVPLCLAWALFALDDLPEKRKHFTEINGLRSTRQTHESPSTRRRSKGYKRDQLRIDLRASASPLSANASNT
jgi:ferredoxin